MRDALISTTARVVASQPSVGMGCFEPLADSGLHQPPIFALTGAAQRWRLEGVAVGSFAELTHRAPSANGGPGADGPLMLIVRLRNSSPLRGRLGASDFVVETDGQCLIAARELWHPLGAPALTWYWVPTNSVSADAHAAVELGVTFETPPSSTVVRLAIRGSSYNFEPSFSGSGAHR